jgi:hypothetical protein
VEKDFYYYKNIVMGIMLVSVIVFLFVLYPYDIRMKHSYSNESYNKTVSSKFINKKNHVERTICFEKNNIIVVGGNHSRNFDLIQEGDSLAKIKGSLIGYIYRDGVLIDSIDHNLDLKYVKKH